MARVPRNLVAVLGAALVIGGLLLALRRPPARSDPQMLAELVTDIADAAGRRDVSSILDHVSAEFRGGAGELRDRDDLRRLLLGALMRASWTRVVVLERTFDVQGGSAVGTVRFVGLSGGAASPAPGMQSYEVGAEFRREGDTWRVVSASYRIVGPQGIR